MGGSEGAATAMRERQAQTVLLVRAFEEADPDGRLLPTLRRTEATRRALEVAEPARAAERPVVIEGPRAPRRSRPAPGCCWTRSRNAIPPCRACCG